jgi:hypothetical protein
MKVEITSEKISECKAILFFVFIQIFEEVKKLILMIFYLLLYYLY